MRAANFLGGIIGLALAGLTGCAPSGPPPAPPEVPLASLVLKDGRLHRPSQSAPFTGMVLEKYPSGQLQSRSVMSNGVLHGLSQGWHTNGVRQVEEHFANGVSEGTRVKWYSNGQKLSEATIVAGKLHGPFRRWHENGRLAEMMELRENQPHGESVAYYPSGCVRVRARLEDGKAVSQETFPDGQVPGPPAVTSVASSPPKS
jgi:antitoxin component YwqK of YwqJK toxin-antitoxin module